MKFALLGTDSESVALARAAVTAGHSIVWCGDIAPDCQLDDDWPAADSGGVWESLLDGEAINAVIVGRGTASSDLRCEQVIQLTKSGVATLTTYPLVDSVLSYYEIDMARNESGAVLHHFNPLVEQYAIIADCADWIANGHSDLGSIEQVVWDRPLTERSKENVLWHFSRDVELLSRVAGRLNRLGALGSPDEAATYAGLSVQLLGRSEVPVRWQVGPVEDAAVARLTLIAQRGKLVVEFDEAGQALQVSTAGDGKGQKHSLEATASAELAIARFVQAVNDSSEPRATWTQALAAMELTDTIEIALRRGRMIEVHQQQLTEQMAFKGTMSALGCGVLLLVPPLLLLSGWIAEVLGLPVPLAKIWPIPLLGLLVLFLLIQLIPKLIFKAEE